jgi:hypothetical protein
MRGAKWSTMTTRASRLPWGIAVFLVYALLVLAGIGLSLPAVVAMATDKPVSLVGLVVMALLAYTIFTVTLVFQRKAAARNLAVGLATLLVPAAIFLLVFWAYPFAVLVAAFAALLFRGLTRPAVAGWLNEV